MTKQQSKSNKVWVLTSQYNDYDQHGEYLVAVFEQKPSATELASFFAMDNPKASFHNPMAALEFILRLVDGGGRKHDEQVWYNLREIEFGQKIGEV